MINIKLDELKLFEEKCPYMYEELRTKLLFKYLHFLIDITDDKDETLFNLYLYGCDSLNQYTLFELINEINENEMIQKEVNSIDDLFLYLFDFEKFNSIL